MKLLKIMTAKKRKRANGKGLMKRNRKKRTRMKTIVTRIVTNLQKKFKDLRAV